MTKTIWEKKWDILTRQMKKEAEERQNRICRYHHYTSLEVLFNILEGDSFWAANVRFSNDSMEERILKLDNPNKRDDYIICFCAEDDMLSQWRGYCHNGGAAIKLKLDSPQNYSILHADYDTSGKFEVSENIPLPVVYLDPKVNESEKRDQIRRTIETSGHKDILLDDILPYLKNGHFYEEKELRLVFSNIGGTLSNCIRFRTLKDGVKVPYIVVKSGNVGKMKGNCQTNISDYDDMRIKELSYKGEAIWIEEGFDQGEKYFEMIERIEKYKRDTKDKYPIEVFCRGRLPIEKITVAPTYDRERKAEQIKRFCMSKYWLKNVKVEVSQIPYIQPSL